jgi:uncharacterized protein (TIGR00369 family)
MTEQSAAEAEMAQTDWPAPAAFQETVAIPLFHSASNSCFGCGESNPVGLRLTFQALPDLTVFSTAVIGSDYEGPRGCVHGGIIATLLDEAMSKANRARGFRAMTRKMDVEYLRPVPTGEPVRLEGRVLRSEGRKHWTAARVVHSSGKVLAEASGLFLEMKEFPNQPKAAFGA